MVVHVILIVTLFPGDKPIGRNCPKDGHFLVEKKIKGGTQVVCPNGDYEEEPQK